MKSFVAVLALGVGANALVSRRTTCCFDITASGSKSGTLGQLSDGQNRVGGGLPAAQYCIDSSSGAITDSSGRGCILTPPTTQFQCDVGATPTTGFSIGCDGTISYQGSETFYECETGDNGEDNIYTSSNGNGGATNCSPVKLSADSCKASWPSGPQACPSTLTPGSYEFPHLIVTVSKSSPDTAAGTSFNGTINSDTSSIFNFDIPSSDSGKTCSLVFLFPEQSQLQTSSFTFSGSGGASFEELTGVATQSTTYNNQPSVKSDLGTIDIKPGNSYVVSTFSCPAGKTVSYEIKSAGSSLNYFQDYNPSPIGLYITTC